MIISIVGPTGVGKTKLSIALAKKYNGIILNADAMQIYKGMNIGTAKIKEEEKEGIPHYLFDLVDVNTNYTVFDYQKDARKILNENKNTNIIMVGGSGLYLKAALYNYVFQNDENDYNYDSYSNEELYKLAQKKDKNMDIHPNNRKRLIRFLKRDIKEEECYPLYNAIYIGLTAKRDILYDRINKRVDEMFKEGLLEEVANFYQQGIKSKAIYTAIGYKDITKLVESKDEKIEEAEVKSSRKNE